MLPYCCKTNFTKSAAKLNCILLFAYLVVVVVVVVVVGQTVGFISSRTLAYNCLCTLE